MTTSAATAPDAGRLPPAGHRFEDYFEAEASRIFGRVVWARLLSTPVVLAVGAWVLATETAPWRRATVTTVVGALVALFVVEVVRYRRMGFGPSSMVANLGAAVVAQLVLSFATGALTSPFLLAAVVLALLCSLLLPRAVATALTVFQVAAIWAMAAIHVTGAVADLVPQSFGGGARGGHTLAHVLWIAGFTSFIVVLARLLGRGFRGVFEGILRRALLARDELLRTHGESVAEMTALSAEIAHELKNPLASVKGLAGLMAATAGGKDAERLAVLRREADRMQGILDGFLGFSRPLGPLSLAEVDLGALAAEVVALHEGMAFERGVTLVTSAPASPVVVRCDPRKIQQALINLVKNALEASPAETTVEVALLPPDGTTRAVEVRDRGRGLAGDGLGERAFAPGFTTKPEGSGLGLTIARAIARQHDGDVTLGARDGGGCRASLTLPAAPA